MTKSQTRSIGGNAGRNRRHNRRVVLEFGRANNPGGRAEIARNCGLNTRAVSNTCESLIHDGLLQEAGYRTGVRGQPVKRYRFDGKGVFAIGEQLRPDALVTAVLSLSGDRIYSDRVALNGAAPEFAVPAVQARINATLDVTRRDRSHLLGVGIVMPGSFGLLNNRTAGVAELPGWNGVDAAALFENALGCPVIIKNDANRMSVRDHLTGSGFPAPDSPALLRLLENGDAVLDNWLGSAAKNLSRAIGILENLFDPQAVILGGAMPDAVLDNLISRLDLPVGSVANHPDRRFARVLRGSSGRLTAAIGGAAMVIHKSITPARTVYQ